MSLLREQFIRELVIRGMSVRTQETYVYWVHQLAKYYHLSPDRLSGDQLKDFLLHLVEQRKLVSSTLNQAASALRCFVKQLKNRGS